MRTIDLIGSAVANTFRSKTRTILTILAIFVGAFTLTLTNGLGTGINAYIDDTVTSIGASDVMTVTKTPGERDRRRRRRAGRIQPGCRRQRPARPSRIRPSSHSPRPTSTPSPGIEGVLDVQATRSISPDYIQAGDGTKYVIGVGSLDRRADDPAGRRAPNPTTAPPSLQLVLPVSFVEPLGLGDSRQRHRADRLHRDHGCRRARSTSSRRPSSASPRRGSRRRPARASCRTTPSATSSSTRRTSACPPTRSSATRRRACSSTRTPPTTRSRALKDRLADAGYTGSTVADQLGTFKTVIDGIVLVLNAFAIIALLAASFGIVNTLLMSVQERTREIGLMKAMGMGNGRVFSLFSLEAAFIGFLGSAIGVVDRDARRHRRQLRALRHRCSPTCPA